MGIQSNMENVKSTELWAAHLADKHAQSGQNVADRMEDYENQTLEAFVAASRLYAKFDCPVACRNFSLLATAHDCETGFKQASFPFFHLRFPKGDFRVSFRLCFKASRSAKPFI